MISIGSVVHLYNEEILLPHWINHHKDLYQEMIFIDHHSTDNSVELIKSLAPEARIITSRLDCFDAQETDNEVMDTELLLNTKWKIAACVTEFMWVKDLPGLLQENKDKKALGLRAYMMVDNVLDQSLYEPLWKNRTNGYLDNETSLNSRRWRFIHQEVHGHYRLGRHNTDLEAVRNPEWNILFAAFSPWPQAVPRKLQIQRRIPLRDSSIGSGIQHQQNEMTLDMFYRSELEKSNNLLLDKNFKLVYDEYIRRMK